MPNVMVALSNIGGALCSTPQSFGCRPLLECRAVTLPKTQKPLKFAGVPQTRQRISVVSRPKFTILSVHVEEVSLLNMFFSDCRYIYASAAKIQPDEVVRWCQNVDICVLYFHPAACSAHISDMHSKFALRPHHVWKYGRHPISDCWDKARKKRKIETTVQKYNGLPYYIGRQ